jgi:D-alanyl-D-alanine carboxypeptidase
VRKLTAFLIILCAGTSATAQTKLPDDVIAEMTAQDAPLEAIVSKAQFSGSVGLVTGNVTRGWNYHRDTVNPQNASQKSGLWRWASVTKQVVAVLVMQEVAKGRIGLDKPLSRYLPKFASVNAGKITVRQLLRHQSGLPNPDDIQASSEAMSSYYLPSYKGSRDPSTGYCAGTVKAEPGGSWAYNNCDYIVAGALLKAVTGKSWQKLVDERIARPLGLKTLSVFPSLAATRSGWIGDRPEPKIDLASFGASGGLYGSIEDMLAFDRALMSGQLLHKNELDILWDSQPDLGFIALGQWVFEAQLKDCAAPVKLVERRGAIGGVQIRNFIAPDQQKAVAIFTDKSESDFEFGEIWQGAGFSHDVLNFALCNKAIEWK